LALPKVDIVKYRNWWFGISLAITVPGLIAVIACWMMYSAPLRPGIDFTGGSLTQYQFAHPVQLQDVRDQVNNFTSVAAPPTHVFEGSQVQEASVGGKQVIVVRTKSEKDDKADESDRKALDESLKAKFGAPKTADGLEVSIVMSRDKVSGVVGPELLSSGLLALFITLGAMVLYIGSRFQYDFAVCAIIALFHDVLVLCGIFAILGLVLGTEVDSLFISAVLTVIGFSVHDTIVVFDRIRENSKFVGSKTTDPVTKKEYRRTFGDIANESVNQTLARSIYTSLTVIITLTALYVLGGTTTRDFVLAMLIGIISGTYSSIFNASALLVWWREQALKKKGKGSPVTTAKAGASA
jgi:preprotein translocase subunit SecF